MDFENLENVGGGSEGVSFLIKGLQEVALIICWNWRHQLSLVDKVWGGVWVCVTKIQEGSDGHKVMG